MEETKQTKKRKMPDIFFILVLVLVLIAGGAGILWSILNNGSESYTSSESTTSMKYLSCEARSQADAFFRSDKSNNSLHKIKIIFSDNSFGEAEYIYNGRFPTEEIAEEEINSMRREYNKFKEKYNMTIDENPIESTLDGADGIIRLHIEPESFYEALAPLMFLTDEEIHKFGKDNAQSTFKKIYESKGFTCVID